MNIDIMDECTLYLFIKNLRELCFCVTLFEYILYYVNQTHFRRDLFSMEIRNLSTKSLFIPFRKSAYPSAYLFARRIPPYCTVGRASLCTMLLVRRPFRLLTRSALIAA